MPLPTQTSLSVYIGDYQQWMVYARRYMHAHRESFLGNGEQCITDDGNSKIIYFVPPGPSADKKLRGMDIKEVVLANISAKIWVLNTPEIVAIMTKHNPFFIDDFNKPEYDLKRYRVTYTPPSFWSDPVPTPAPAPEPARRYDYVDRSLFTTT